MSYSPYTMLFALMAFLWSLMTFYKVQEVKNEQTKLYNYVEQVFSLDLSLPDEE